MRYLAPSAVPFAPRGWVNLNALPTGRTYLSAPDADSEDGQARPSGTVVDAVAPDGRLPGDEPVKSAGGRNMPASEDPDSTALDFVIRSFNGQIPASVRPISDQPGAIVFEMADGTFITYRPAGLSSALTPSTMATVQINNPVIRSLNGGDTLKLKFPQQ